MHVRMLNSELFSKRVNNAHDSHYESYALIGHQEILVLFALNQ